MPGESRSRALEEFWAEVLSAEPARIRTALAALSGDDHRTIVLHLHRMAHESGWSEAQRLRAQAALDALKGLDPSDT
jgi:hypothetical protein